MFNDKLCIFFEREILHNLGRYTIKNQQEKVQGDVNSIYLILNNAGTNFSYVYSITSIM